MRPSRITPVTQTVWAVSPPETVLLSYPRSGNTWLRYCVEYLSQRPTNGACQHSVACVLDACAMTKAILHTLCPLTVLADLGVDMSQPAILHKAHEIDPDRYTPDVRLILLLRNYKDAFVRRLYASPTCNALVEEWEVCVPDLARRYTKYLQDYTEWSGTKLLVYYEELLTKPETTLTAILDFLAVPHTPRLTELLANIDAHKRRALAVYESFGNRPFVARGKNHSNICTPVQRHYLDTVMKEIAGPLYTYVARYAEGGGE